MLSRSRRPPAFRPINARRRNQHGRCSVIGGTDPRCFAHLLAISYSTVQNEAVPLHKASPAPLSSGIACRSHIGDLFGSRIPFRLDR